MKLLGKPIIEVKKGGKKISGSFMQNTATQSNIPNSAGLRSIKYAITENDWDAYLKSRENFYTCLRKYDWSEDIPQLEEYKKRHCGAESSKSVIED